MRALILLSLLIATAAFAADWVDLLDGETLLGWRQQNGTATYRVVDGAIVGETAEASPNSFLCITRDYGDFEMDFDVEVHDRLNTGIIVRARGREKTVALSPSASGICRVVPHRPCQPVGSRTPGIRPLSANAGLSPCFPRCPPRKDGPVLRRQDTPVLLCG